MIFIKDIAEALNTFAPTCYAEDFDNVGMQIGDENKQVTGVLVTLDVTEEVLQEAIQNNCNLIVSFHPLIFKPSKNILFNNRVGSLCQLMIKNDLALYCIHTNLDNQFNGVNKKIADIIGLNNYKILIPKSNVLYSLRTFVPNIHLQEVRDAVFSAGAGEIGNYKNCSFFLEGTGTFLPVLGANPFSGCINELSTENESLLNVLVPLHAKENVLNTLFKAHPYETVAYEISQLANTNQTIGSGGIGELDNPISETEFLELLGTRFNSNFLRHSKFLRKKIKKIALVGGSGSFAINDAIKQNADAFVTADLKYHDFFLAQEKLFLVDFGHYESEQFTKNIIVKFLEEKFTKFAIFQSKISSNSVNYYTCHQKQQQKTTK